MIVYMIVENRYSVSDYKEKQELISLAPSSKFILYILKQRGPLNRNEILSRTLLPKRTVAYALKKLREKEFIVKHKDVKDKRISIFESKI
ncbi:MAG: MarR family transcriptional regulator [Promethearchaeota archaeon]|nr:MAG: MarR family transcriptional regulator [Candidatus Lokiarchaeota archaeon]